MTGQQKVESAATTGASRGPDVEQLLGLALRHHRGGRLADAEPIYRTILTKQPDHLLALQFLGVLAHQSGNSHAAIELIGKALALDAGIPDAQYNMGSVLQSVGRFEEAAAHYGETIRICPDHVAAHYELGNVLAKQGKLDPAAECYRRALTLHPRYLEALNNLGLVLMRQGDLPGAVTHWHRALTLDPCAVTTHVNLAFAHEAQGNVAAAIDALRRALELQPDHAGALCALGPLLCDIGEIGEALDCAVRALRIRETVSAKTLFVRCIRHLVELPDRDDARDLVLRALSEPWGRPAALAAAATRFVKLNPAVRTGIDRAMARRRQGDGLLGSFDFAAVCRERLLTTLLESAPIHDNELERFLTEVRLALLDAAGRAADGDRVDDAVLGFCCALACQCFINEYVFAQDPDEAERAASLRGRLTAALQSGAPVPVMWLATAAAYFPLDDVPGSASLLARSWPEPVNALLIRQVREPMAERAGRATIPALTPIDDEVSLVVRHAYEENPYPRWMKTAPVSDPESIDVYLRTRYPAVPFTDLGKRSGLDILVAGCGTGQQSVECGWNYPDAQILAVDLSLASLAYAQRQTRAARLANVEYAQADLMKLGSLGRTFDLIEVTGVLHHLADPEAGWRVLLSLLRPGGFMKIGLYSARAREGVVAGRSFIAARGYTPTPDGIRQCRQDILSADPGTPLRNLGQLSDFFTVGECRDLLFHPCEHRFTLPRIGAFLTERDLVFIGFELDAHIKWRYAQRFPSDLAMTDLDCWHCFEEENQRTFLRMYQFWIQRKHARPHSGPAESITPRQ